MRFSAALVVACFLGASAASAVAPTKLLTLERIGQHKFAPMPAAKPKECPTCINFMIQSLDTLVDAIANGGVIGGCEKLCGFLPKEVEFAVCSAICIFAGVEELVRVLNTTDPDPIYVCEEINICPISDNSAASIDSVIVEPSSGPLRTTFWINMTFTVINATGTGVLMMWAVPPNTPFDDGLGEEGYMIETPPGTYRADFEIPTSDGNEDWVFGTYNCSVWLCEGYCDSIHKHQYIMAMEGDLYFTITKKDGLLSVVPPRIPRLV